MWYMHRHIHCALMLVVCYAVLAHIFTNTHSHAHRRSDCGESQWVEVRPNEEESETNVSPQKGSVQPNQIAVPSMRKSTHTWHIPSHAQNQPTTHTHSSSIFVESSAAAAAAKQQQKQQQHHHQTVCIQTQTFAPFWFEMLEKALKVAQYIQRKRSKSKKPHTHTRTTRIHKFEALYFRWNGVAK